MYLLLTRPYRIIVFKQILFILFFSLFSFLELSKIIILFVSNDIPCWLPQYCDSSNHKHKRKMVPLSSILSLLQCGLRCCPGQKCSHQEVEQTLPEPDPRKEGLPGVGAHEMCQSQKCKWFSWGVMGIGTNAGRMTMSLLSGWGTVLDYTPLSVYFWFLINPFATKLRQETATLRPC